MDSVQMWMSFFVSTETVAVFALARRVPFDFCLYAFVFMRLAPVGISIFIPLGELGLFTSLFLAQLRGMWVIPGSVVWVIPGKVG